MNKAIFFIVLMAIASVVIIGTQSLFENILSPTVLRFILVGESFVFYSIWRNFHNQNN